MNKGSAAAVEVGGATTFVWSLLIFFICVFVCFDVLYVFVIFVGLVEFFHLFVVVIFPFFSPSPYLPINY